MAPAQKRKILYPLFCIGVLTVALAAPLSSSVRGVLVLLLLVPGRVQGYYWREFFRGRQAMSRQQHEVARDHFRRFLDLLQKRPWMKRLMWCGFGIYSWDIEAVTYNNLGAAALETGELAQSQVALERALSIDRNYPKANFNLGLLYARSDNPQRAKEYLAEARRLGFDAGQIDRALMGLAQGLAAVESHPDLPQADPRSSAHGDELP